MHWDPKRNKWTSLSQQRRDDRKEAMSLFRKKPKTETESAFDRIPQEAQDKLIEDVLSIVRTVRAWPELVPAELHAPIAEEVAALLRKTSLKLASALMGGGAGGEDIANAFKGVAVPRLMSQTFIAIKLALTDKFVPPTEGPPDGQAA